MCVLLDIAITVGMNEEVDVSSKRYARKYVTSSYPL